MKWILRIILIVFVPLGMNRVHAQTVQLVPDSCTFCMFLVSTGGTGWYESGYGIFPNEDTVVLGNNYMRVNAGFDSRQPFAIRQAGNKLMGLVADSLSEYLIMDFDADIADTIHDLYSEGFFYDAVVIRKDSIMVNNGIYHHFMELNGIGVYTSSGFTPENWTFVWNERGLCASNGWGGWDLGGVLYNLPTNYYSISAVYAFPDYCTTDPIYTNPGTVTCDNCVAQTNGLNELLAAKLSVSPNPVSDELTIRLEDSGIKKIAIYNTYGVKVKEESIHSQEINIQISELLEGFYFLEVETDKGQLSAGFVKN